MIPCAVRLEYISSLESLPKDSLSMATHMTFTPRFCNDARAVIHSPLCAAVMTTSVELMYSSRSISAMASKMGMFPVGLLAAMCLNMLSRCAVLFSGGAMMLWLPCAAYPTGMKLLVYLFMVDAAIVAPYSSVDSLPFPACASIC